jgi:flagellar hook protein FlgE
MIKSLYSGVSGLRCNQTKLDVLSNNIANVSTSGFKAGRVTFQDLFSQTISGAQAATDDIGGIKAQQVGLGVSIGSIDTIMSNGSIQPTNRDLDFAVSGKGFFVLSPDDEGERFTYTRDGAFYTDNEGNLVNSEGMHVLGFSDGDPTDDADDIDTEGDLNDLELLNIPDQLDDDERLEKLSVDSTGLITAVYGGETYYIGRIALASFSNAEGLEKAGANAYKKTANSGEALVGTAGTSGFGVIQQSALESSNVDLASEMTEMIITSRAYQANVNSIKTSDEILQELVNVSR